MNALKKDNEPTPIIVFKIHGSHVDGFCLCKPLHCCAAVWPGLLGFFLFAISYFCSLWRRLLTLRESEVSPDTTVISPPQTRKVAQVNDMTHVGLFLFERSFETMVKYLMFARVGWKNVFFFHPSRAHVHVFCVIFELRTTSNCVQMTLSYVSLLVEPSSAYARLRLLTPNRSCFYNAAFWLK